MKPVSLITAGLVAVGLVSAASAQTVVRITGSTAYRANINNILDGVVTDTSGHNLVFDSNPSVLPSGGFTSSASSLVFTGTINGGTPVIVETAFTGSEAGIAAISKTDGTGTSIANAIANIKSDSNVHVANTPNAAATVPNTPQAAYLDTTTGTTSANQPSDLSMTDTSVAVSLTKTAAITDANAGNPVGIVQFKWMKGWSATPDSSWTDLVNVTLPQANVLLSAGEQPASFLTGAVADTDLVPVVGRNKGSGTRVNVLADLNYGITKNVIQCAVGAFSYNASGVLQSPTGTTISGPAQVAKIFNDGFDSGSGVKASLNLDCTGSGYVPIGYIGLADAAGVTHAASQNLTVNGVAYSDAAIEEGQYSYFGHEHLYYGNNVSATAQTIAGKLVGAFATSETGGVSGIPVASMQADRSGDTGYPAPQ